MPDDLRRRYASAVLSDFYEPHEIKESAHYGGSVFAAVDRILAVRDEELESLRELVRDLTDEDSCWFDHHGYCQAHGWMDTEPRCPHGRAQDLLTALDLPPESR
ncbi:hypothetical protein [Streptosporangium sp. G12]